MKVVLYGASGMIGSRVLHELLSRGHKVTAVVRNPEKLAAAAGVKVLKGDVTDAASVAATAAGTEAAISAYAAPQDQPEMVVTATHSLLAGLAKAGVPRMIVVGGAGSLEVAPACSWWILPSFRAVEGQRAGPSKDIADPERVEFGLDLSEPGSPHRARTADRKISRRRHPAGHERQGRKPDFAEDFAIVLVDELEHPKHVRQQFTAAY